MNNTTLSRSMRLSVAEGGLATAMGSLFSGVFLTGFALSLGASRLQIGILFALPALCGLSQILGSYLIEHFGNTKRICVTAMLISRLLYIPVLLVPLVARDLSAENQVWCIIGLMALSNALCSLGGVAWLTWIKALIPQQVLVTYFGRRNLVNASLAFVACLAAGALVDVINRGQASQFPGFFAVFVIAMTCGLAGWVVMARVPAAEVAAPTEKRPPFRTLLAAPLREANFRRVVLFYAAWNLAVNLAAPFYAVFFMQKLGLPVWYVVVLTTLASLSGMAANNFWTRLAQRFGIKPVVLVATLGDALYPLMLVFVTGDWTWVLLAVHLTGIFNTPIAIGPDNFILKLTPQRNASSYMAVFRAVVGPATAVAAIVGGWMASLYTTQELQIGIGALGGLKIVFLVSGVGRLASLALLWGVHEPKARTVRQVVRVLHRAASRRLTPQSTTQLPPIAPQPTTLPMASATIAEPASQGAPVLLAKAG